MGGGKNFESTEIRIENGTHGEVGTLDGFGLILTNPTQLEIQNQ